jgi:hypothetical protein
VVYNGKTYSVLSHVSAVSTLSACQVGYLPLDAGYVIAPDDADSKAVITAYPWNTAAVIVGTGNAYKGANFATAGTLFGSGYLHKRGSGYKTSLCTAQILQVIYTRVLCSDCCYFDRIYNSVLLQCYPF